MRISSTSLEHALADERDIFHRFLVRGIRLPKLVILTFLLVLNAASLFGGGWIISYSLYPNANIIRVFDVEFFYNALFNAFVIFPIIIALYLWQPLERQIIRMLQVLRTTKSIKEDLERVDIQFFKDQKRSIMIAALATALAFILVQHFWVYPVENAKTQIPYFWQYALCYYWLLYTPIMYLAYYMIGSVMINVVFVLFWLRIFFKQVEIDVHPLHPDGAGGLGSVGELSVKLSGVFVALGFIASITTVTRLLIGNGWFYADTIFEYILYILLVPFALIAPMWSVHKKMVEERDAILLSISREFEAGLAGRSSKSSRLAQEREKSRLNELNERYKLIIETYPTWPLHVSLLKNFSITAIIPFVTGTLSIGLDLLK